MVDTLCVSLLTLNLCGRGCMLTRHRWIILNPRYISHHKLNGFNHISLLRLVYFLSVHLFLCLPRLLSVLQYIRYSTEFGNIFHARIIRKLVTERHRLLLEICLALLKLTGMQEWRGKWMDPRVSLSAVFALKPPLYVYSINNMHL